MWTARRTPRATLVADASTPTLEEAAGGRGPDPSKKIALGALNHGPIIRAPIFTSIETVGRRVMTL